MTFYVYACSTMCILICIYLFYNGISKGAGDSSQGLRATRRQFLQKKREDTCTDLVLKLSHKNAALRSELASMFRYIGYYRSCRP